MIEIAPYNPEWAAQFGEMKSVLTAALRNLACAVEHVGSTSVPGLAAKPIIDMDLVIESRALLPRTLEALSRLGYFHQGDLGISGREALGRDGADVPRDGSGRTWPEHHLYVCAKDNEELRRHLAFRNFLRTHTSVAREYAALKCQLALQHPDDRERYCLGKTEFVEQMLRAAAQDGPELP